MYATLLFDLSQMSFVTFSPVVVNPADGQSIQGSLAHSPSADHSRRAVAGGSAPVSLVTCLDQLAMATRQRMQTLQCTRLQVPAAFAQRTSVNGKFNLETSAWSVSGNQSTAQLRMVKIDGARCHILNTWCFPEDPRVCPIYAAELIGVGEGIRVAFVDVQAPVRCTLMPALQAGLEKVARDFQQLPCDEAAPDWATEASLGCYTYARNVPTSDLMTIQACYLNYLDYYLSLAANPAGAVGHELSLDQARANMHSYQLHHMQHSPGQKFLGNLFGEQWTEEFMSKFLFTLP